MSPPHRYLENPSKITGKLQYIVGSSEVTGVINSMLQFSRDFSAKNLAEMHSISTNVVSTCFFGNFVQLNKLNNHRRWRACTSYLPKTKNKLQIQRQYSE